MASHLTKLWAIPAIGKHPDIISRALTTQARLTAEKGNFQECYELHEQAWEIRSVFFGGDSAAVATSLNYLGAITDDLGRSEESLECFHTALEIRRNLFGSEHPDVAYTLNALIAPYMQLGYASKALAYAKEAYEIRLNVFGPNHLLVAESIRNVAMLSSEVNEDHNAALLLYRQALHILQKHFAEGQHIDFAAIYYGERIIVYVF